MAPRRSEITSDSSLTSITSNTDHSYQPSLSSISGLDSVPNLEEHNSARGLTGARTDHTSATASQITPYQERATRRLRKGGSRSRPLALDDAETSSTNPEHASEAQEEGDSRPLRIRRRRVVVSDSSSSVSFTTAMSGRPRNARAAAGRDHGNESDIQQDYLNRVIESIKKAQEHNEDTKRSGDAIIQLEEEIKRAGHSTPEQHRRLDALYRKHLRSAEAEKKVLEEDDVVNNIAILKTMTSTEEPSAPRNGTAKGRKNQKQILESDLIAESPSTPTDGKSDLLKRVKGASQRSSSVASQNRASTARDEVPEVKVEKPGPLAVGTEVFYKLQKGDNDEGVGQHQIIRKVLQEKKGNTYYYDLKDPDKAEASRKGIPAKHLAVIPAVASASPPVYPVGSEIYARYPDTDTFYQAEVRGFSKGQYTLHFHGEDDPGSEHIVERRYVLDPSRWQ